MLEGLPDYQSLNWMFFIAAMTAVVVPAGLIALRWLSDPRRSKTLLLLLIPLLGYGLPFCFHYGSNASHAGTENMVYSTVKAKRFDSDRGAGVFNSGHPTYYLETTEGEITVPASVFDQTKTGDRVQVKVSYPWSDPEKNVEWAAK